MLEAENPIFQQLPDMSIQRPSDLLQAEQVCIRMVKAGAATHSPSGFENVVPTAVLTAGSELTSDEIQNLGDNVPLLFQLRAKHSTPPKVTVRIELGDGKTMPADSIAAEFNRVLKGVKDGLVLK